MSLWHIPVVPTDPFLDDMMEMTFPPLRYFPLFNDRPFQRMIRDQDRFYKELVDSISPSKRSAAAKGGFVANLDVKHFKPEEVTLKVEGIF